VLAELAAEDPDLTAWLRPRLPDKLAALLRPAPVPDAVVAGHPRRILPDELDRRLRELEDWSGDCHRISRTVLLPQEWIEPLWQRVNRAEQDVGHHVRIERIDGGVRFVGWTRSIDAVTELDLALATRIDDAVRTL
jgi:pterin-4a-carbinolamine dehydratase